MTLTNLCTGQDRIVAGRICVCIASGNCYPNWRRGYTRLDPGESFVAQWPQLIPATESVIGNNIFILSAQDVTPAPYNQPPYPPSGDTCCVTNTVAASAP